MGPSPKSQALKETLEGSTVSIGINESRFPLLRLCRYLYEESDPLATTSPQGTGTRNARRLTKFLLALNDTSQELSKALMRGSGVQARPARSSAAASRQARASELGCAQDPRAPDAEILRDQGPRQEHHRCTAGSLWPGERRGRARCRAQGTALSLGQRRNGLWCARIAAPDFAIQAVLPCVKLEQS